MSESHIRKTTLHLQSACPVHLQSACPVHLQIACPGELCKHLRTTPPHCQPGASRVSKQRWWATS
eukprot:710355-Amphidinium_carterae.4